jgi:CRP-like cAMP-binding protein
MSIEDDIAFLEQVPILRRIGAGALRVLAIGAESFYLDPSQILFNIDEPADGAYVVQAGSFSLRSGRPGVDEIVAGPGSLLGESALIAETLRPATATALEDSTVLRISRAMFLKMLESYPDAAQSLRALIASRSDQWTREIENVRDALTRGANPKQS